jgi:hypothetical protein
MTISTTSRFTEASNDAETYDVWFARRAQAGLARLKSGVEKVYTESEWIVRCGLMQQKMAEMKQERLAVAA